MTDGGTLYRWREDQRKYAPESVKHALIREESGIARDWWEPVCSLAEYLGVELREPDDKIDVAQVREYVANSEYWRGTGGTPADHAARAAAMWLREYDSRCRHVCSGSARSERCWKRVDHLDSHESAGFIWLTNSPRDSLV